jgi:hypothetical protein
MDQSGPGRVVVQQATLVVHVARQGPLAVEPRCRYRARRLN